MAGLNINQAFDAIIRHGWRDKRLPGGDVIQLATFDGKRALLTCPPEDEGWTVTAMRHRPSQTGSNKQIRYARVLIPFENWMKHPPSDGALVDFVVDYMQLLVAKLDDPPKPPKGWKKFGRAARSQ